MAEIISALTASGHKSICVYDIRLNLLGRIESWVSLVWPERYNVYSDTQGAQLELHDTTALQALCRPDRYLWLVGSDRLMRIVSAQKSDHKLVIAAKDAACAVGDTLWSIADKPGRYEVTDGGVMPDPADQPEPEPTFKEQLASAQSALADADALNLDQDYRLTLLELGVTDDETTA